MNKKQDLLNVFSFIAEFLSAEDSNVNDETKKLLTETSTLPNIEKAETNILNHLGVIKTDNLASVKTSKHILGNDIKYIKDIMVRVDDKNKEKVETNNLLNNQRKIFENQIKNLQKEFTKKLQNEKTEESLEIIGNTTSNESPIKSTMLGETENFINISTPYAAIRE